MGNRRVHSVPISKTTFLIAAIAIFAAIAALGVVSSLALRQPIRPQYAGFDPRSVTGSVVNMDNDTYVQPAGVVGRFERALEDR